ncbi:MAG: ferric reductase-like transmembrane domain-containing protein [Pseudomonadota bacterium]
MQALKSIWDHPYTFWLLPSLLAIPMLSVLASGEANAIHNLLHPTGEFAARFVIIAMIITPLTLLFKGWRGPRWLMKRRRYLGVAAFGCAALHTVLYLIDEGAVAISGAEIAKLYIWTGWLAFLTFVPLAIMSTDGWVHSLGPRWKSVQR